MNAIEVAIVVAGTLMVAAAMIAVMVRINQSERRLMDRRHEEWIAGGSVPEEKPNFFSGNLGG